MSNPKLCWFVVDATVEAVEVAEVVVVLDVRKQWWGCLSVVGGKFGGATEGGRLIDLFEARPEPVFCRSAAARARDRRPPAPRRGARLPLAHKVTCLPGLPFVKHRASPTVKATRANFRHTLSGGRDKDGRPTGAGSSCGVQTRIRKQTPPRTTSRRTGNQTERTRPKTPIGTALTPP